MTYEEYRNEVSRLQNECILETRELSSIDEIYCCRRYYDNKIEEARLEYIKEFKNNGV